MKTCTKCGETKSLELFAENLKGRFGRQSWCRACTAKRSHDRYLERKSNPRQRPERKVCGRCHAEKPATAFPVNHSYKDGVGSICKRCTRHYKLQAVYGITIEDYDRLLMEQGGKCAICGASPSWRELAVDHDHVTGMVRGLLCPDCNTAVGLFKDSQALLQAAITYLQKH